MERELDLAGGFWVSAQGNQKQACGGFPRAWGGLDGERGEVRMAGMALRVRWDRRRACKVERELVENFQEADRFGSRDLALGENRGRELVEMLAGDLHWERQDGRLAAAPCAGIPP